jgi:hypothetical protein
MGESWLGKIALAMALRGFCERNRPGGCGATAREAAAKTKPEYRDQLRFLTLDAWTVR